MAENVGDFMYNKKDLIGHGAFAVVFKGSHKKKDDFVVAIKVITKKNLSKTQSLLAKEIKILKELHHENVVALFDCQETENHVYLVMEYCNGGDLADYLHDKGTLSEDTICIFLRQVASAMCALQSKGIVHRDLKPQNLLLSHSGHGIPMPANIRLKIADFGFARFLTGEMMAATLCGSPMYMAPEVIMSKAYDAKADLWSVGTIVYQCLTGKAPFQANSPQALKKFYEKNKNVKPQIPAGTSQQLTDLLFGLLKRNPRDRMDFGEFFNHPFLTGIVSPHKTSTPVAVPSRQRTNSGSSRHRNASHSPSTSPNGGAEALGDIRVDLLRRMTPPYDISGTSPNDPPSIINVSAQSPVTAYSRRSPGRAASPSSPYRSGQDDDMGFVMVPSNPEANEGVHPRRNTSDPLFPVYETQSPPLSSRRRQTSPGTPSSSPSPRKATFTIGSPSSSPSSSPQAWPPTFNSPSNSPSTRSPSSPQNKHQDVRSVPVPIPGRQISCPSSVASSPKLQKTRDSAKCLTPPAAMPRKISKDSCASPQTTNDRTSIPGGGIDIPGQKMSPQKSDNRVSVMAPPAVRRHTVSTPPKPGTLMSAAKAITDQGPGGFEVKNLGTALSSPPHMADNTELRCRLSSDPVSVTTPKSSTIQRALKQISSPPNSSSPILSALARQTVADVVLPSTSNESEKQIVKVHSSPAILAMAALPRNKSFLNNPTFQLGSGANTRMAPAIFRHNSNPGFSPLKVVASPNVPVTSSPPTPGALPTIPGSPTKTSLHPRGDISTDDGEIKPLRGLFVAASPPTALQLQGNLIQFGTLPLVGPTPTTSGQPATVTQGTKVTLGFGENSAFARGNADRMAVRAQQVDPCSPEMEGPIELVAPELPEDTLMEVEHTEGIRKLNVALSVVDAIMEVVNSRGAPLISLADSMAIKPNESFLADHIGFISDECRKTEQLMLYVKALHALNVALQFAKSEMMVGHLKPSNAVKNAVNDLNARYHQCLGKASDLKQHLLRSSKSFNGRTITVSANKLMYAYAMELCQNAALDELFGNPKECKKKYETAQFLLQGLEEDTKKDNDRQLLQKYRAAVNRRLVYLTNTRLRNTSQCSSR